MNVIDEDVHHDCVTIESPHESDGREGQCVPQSILLSLTKRKDPDSNQRGKKKTSGARDTHNPDVIDALAVLDEVRAFSAFNKATEAGIIGDIPYFVNQFWTSVQRSGPDIHQVPYRACFKPSLADFFIGLLSRPEDTVHDPFMGRGTVPVQAGLMGRHAYGSDINPVSILLTRPRLNPITIEEIVNGLATIDWTVNTPWPENLVPFFHPETLRQIMALRHWHLNRAPLHDSNPDVATDWIRMATMARLTGHSPGYLSNRSWAPNQMARSAVQMRLNARNGFVSEEKNAAEIILAKSCDLLGDGCAAPNTQHHLDVSPAWHTPWIKSASIDLVLTSPPFVDVVDYGHEHWMRAWFAGIRTEDIAFSHHASVDVWTTMIRKTLVELMRVVKPGGYIAIEVGDVRGGKVNLERYVWQAAQGLPCSRLGVIVHAAEFTKSAHCFGVKNNSKGTNSNRIVLMQRR